MLIQQTQKAARLISALKKKAKNMSLKNFAELFIPLIFALNSHGMSGDNRIAAFGSFSTKGLESKSADKFHWKISYERGFETIVYVSIG